LNKQKQTAKILDKPFSASDADSLSIKGELVIEKRKHISAINVYFVNEATGHYTSIGTFYTDKDFHGFSKSYTLNNAQTLIKTITRADSHPEKPTTPLTLLEGKVK